MRIERWICVLAIALAGLLGMGGPARAMSAVEASAECVKCHDSEDMADWSRNAHAPSSKPPVAGAVVDPRTPSCIGCHGASPNHVNKPEDAKERPLPDVVFTKRTTQSAQTRTDACLSCHQRDAKRMLWAGSQHERADLACNSCHKVHSNTDKVTVKAMQVDVCYTCHKDQRGQFGRPSHHPVPEGKMVCSDCHNAHGSAGPKLVKRDSTNDTCYTCHAEKRGPFVHQHEPVTEDCSNCHNPHGSTVSAMLTARPPMLCQQCHTPHVAGGVGAVGGQPGVYAPAVPGQSGPAVTGISSGKNVVNIWQGRSCTNCHTQVHGSNNPSVTNPTPQFMFR